MFHVSTNSTASSILQRETHLTLCRSPIISNPNTNHKRFSVPIHSTKTRRISQTSLGSTRKKVTHAAPPSPRQQQKHLKSQPSVALRPKRVSQSSQNSRRVRISQISVSSSQKTLSQNSQIPRRKRKTKSYVSQLGCHRSQRSSTSSSYRFSGGGGRLPRSRKQSQRWSTSSDHQYFQRIHEWKKTGDENNKDNL